MPIIKSAKKALRQSEKRKVRNLRRKRDIKETTKKLKKSIEAKNIEEAKQLLINTYKTLDKAVKTGIIKKNTANRKKSRLTKALNKLS